MPALFILPKSCHYGQYGGRWLPRREKSSENRDHNMLVICSVRETEFHRFACVFIRVPTINFFRRGKIPCSIETGISTSGSRVRRCRYLSRLVRRFISFLLRCNCAFTLSPYSWNSLKIPGVT